MSYAGTDYFSGSSFGWRQASNIEDEDKYSAVLRLSSGILWSVDYQNQYFSVDQLGLELAGVSGFNARERVPTSSTGIRFMPLDLNFTESLDVLLKTKVGFKNSNVNLLLAGGANFSVMKPLNAVMITESKHRVSPKILIGLQRSLNKNWAVDLSLHHVFNNYNGDPKTQRVTPFELSGFVEQTMVTLGTEYRTNFI